MIKSQYNMIPFKQIRLSLPDSELGEGRRRDYKVMNFYGNGYVYCIDYHSFMAVYT